MTNANLSPPSRRQIEVESRIRIPLLTLITAESLERDYQMVARRRASRGDPPAKSKRLSRLSMAAVTLSFGGLVALAAVETSANADVDSASRASLIERIEVRRARVQRLQGTIADLRRANVESEATLIELGNQVNLFEARAVTLSTVAGFGAVSGPGLRIEIENGAFADPDTEHVRDSDLALLANGLWTAGAEAIAINGQRITVRTAIRNSGRPIEVNSTGIAPPYVVVAIGDRNALASRLLETSSGAAFTVLASQFGWVYEIDDVEQLQLPAAPARLRQLRSAGPIITSGRQLEGDG